MEFNLKAFKSEKNGFLLRSAVEISRSSLRVSFNWNPLSSSIYFTTLNNNQVSNRKRELWKKTCFEVFVKDYHSQKYYEFNFNEKGEWNVYVFDSYRNPQELKEFEKAELKKINFKLGHIEAEFEIDISNWEKVQLGTTCVIEHLDERKSYYALIHLAENPDFHHPKSFLIERNLL